MVRYTFEKYFLNQNFSYLGYNGILENLKNYTCRVGERIRGPRHLPLHVANTAWSRILHSSPKVTPENSQEEFLNTVGMIQISSKWKLQGDYGERRGTVCLPCMFQIWVSSLTPLWSIWAFWGKALELYLSLMLYWVASHGSDTTRIIPWTIQVFALNIQGPCTEQVALESLGEAPNK